MALKLILTLLINLCEGGGGRDECVCVCVCVRECVGVLAAASKKIVEAVSGYCVHVKLYDLEET